MSHLNGETLARLVDEAPTALEAAHLAECVACRTGLDGMRADTRALAALGPIDPPVRAWSALEERLHAEGLVRPAGALATTPAWLRLAAALTLFLTGTLAGFAWRTATLPAASVAVAPATENEARDGRPAADSGEVMSTETIAAIPAPTMDQPAQRLDSSSQRAAADAAPRSRTVEAEQSTRRADAARADEAGPEDREPRIIGPASPDARFAAMTERSPRTPQEAAVLLREAEAMYLDALARYAHLAGSEEDAGDPLARLAALEGIVLTTREALGRAPADPIINGYHMTALAQREATLRQIAATTRNPWF